MYHCFGIKKLANAVNIPIFSQKDLFAIRTLFYYSVMKNFRGLVRAENTVGNTIQCVWNLLK